MDTDDLNASERLFLTAVDRANHHQGLTSEFVAELASEALELLAHIETQAETIESLRSVLAGLLGVAERSRSGDSNLHPEDWYLWRDEATAALAGSQNKE